MPSEENVKDAPLSVYDDNPGGNWSSNAHSICGALRVFSQRTVMMACRNWLAGMTILIVFTIAAAEEEEHGGLEA